MQIIEIKNNLVRVGFDASQENLILSGFLIIKDSLKSFIAQIVYIEAETRGNFAIARLLFTFDSEGVVTDYDGTIPDINEYEITNVGTDEFLYLLPSKRKILLGDIAQQKEELVLDQKLFEQKLLICSERAENNELLFNNLQAQLASKKAHVVIFDKRGTLNFGNKITAGGDFKLPLNYDTINFIYKKGLDEATAECRALIQDILLEVQNYIQTLPDKFLPFDTFKDVVDKQYNELGIVQLILLKNKLLKFKAEGLFAERKEEIDSLKNSILNENVTVIDMSKLDENFQREYVFYTISAISETKGKYYVITDVADETSDKKLLKHLYSKKNIYPSVICSYNYKYLAELKQLSRNLILFAPIQQQSDFASYNIFLQKLNSQEFVIFGKETHNVPLIVKLNDKPQTKFIENVGVEENDVEEEETETKETAKPAINVVPIEKPLPPELSMFTTPPFEEQAFDNAEEQPQTKVSSPVPVTVPVEATPSFIEVPDSLVPETQEQSETLEKNVTNSEIQPVQDEQELPDLNENPNEDTNFQETEQNSDSEFEDLDLDTEVTPENAEILATQIADEINSENDTVEQEELPSEEIITENDQTTEETIVEPQTSSDIEQTPLDAEFPTVGDGEFDEEDLNFIQGLSKNETTEGFGMEVLPNDETSNVAQENITPEQNDNNLESAQEATQISEFPQEETNQEEFSQNENVQDDIFDEITQNTPQEEVLNEEPIDETNLTNDIDDLLQNSSPAGNPFDSGTSEIESQLDDDILPVTESEGSMLPVYNADIPQQNSVNANEFNKGDKVSHPKYGNGSVEKMISYGNKTLCSILFENEKIGRRLLDPSIADLKKI